MRFAFVCTNFNNSALTREAIASLRGQDAGDAPLIVVVDNHSRAEEVAILKAAAASFAGVELVLGSENVGYFPGLNVGIQRAARLAPDAEVIVVGNNDLVFPATFASALDQHRALFDRWAVVAPDIVTLDGEHQNPHVLRPISAVRRWVWDLYFSSFPVARLVKRGARLTKSLTARPENKAGMEFYKDAGPVEQGYGACYLLGPRFFEHFTGLFAPTFLMQEEYFLSEQLKTIGQETYYEPGIQVRHCSHATMSKLPSREHWNISRRSHLVYKRYLRLAPEERLRMLAEWRAPAPTRGEG